MIKKIHGSLFLWGVEMRLGTYYRSLVVNKLGITANMNLVLDVGSFDGYWLPQQAQPQVKTALDLNPNNKYRHIIYVKANALFLPFKEDVFEQVFAFDVIEHVSDDKQFVNELCRVCKIGGEIIISTPHKEIKVFPPFLTNWVSKKWGHYRVNGYLESEIKNIIPKNVVYEVLHIRMLFYRTFYFLLRFLWGINEKFAKPFVKFIAYMELHIYEGRER
jgi:SAM-dependent methyltransferase